MKLKWSYAILALMAVLLTMLDFGFTIHEVGVTDHKFCQVVTGVTVNPVLKPVDPKANPSREHDYDSYIRFVNLGNSLGC